MNTRQFMLLKEIPGDYAYDEAIRTLRTNLQFSGRNIKAVMFTSSLPDEGKSSICFSLAHALAQIGKKTVLVDADIRKSVLLSRCEVKGEVDGLSQYLSGQRMLKEVIFATNVENLSVIFAGPYSPNPAELLEEELCGQMFEALRHNFDYIIVDTPPMANLTDGAIVAGHCDGAVMVIESGAISYHLEQKVKTQLEKTGCRLLGVVLNKVEAHGKGYYGKYGRYGGKYKKYGKYDKYGQYDRYGQPGKNVKFTYEKTDRQEKRDTKKNLRDDRKEQKNLRDSRKEQKNLRDSRKEQRNPRDVHKEQRNLRDNRQRIREEIEYWELGEQESEEEFRERELREQELSEHELNRQELGDEEFREHELSEQELKDEEFREHELRDDELREQEFREQESEDRRSGNREGSGNTYGPQ